MGRRPDIAYELSPSELIPGTTLTVTLVFTSDADTPFDGIRVILRGREKRLRERAGEHGLPTYAEGALRLEARIDGGVLGRWTHRSTVTFDLPPDLAPSYLSEVSDNVYELDVHVDIPWWLDARETFTVRASPLPVTRDATPPLLASTAPEPTGDELFVEAAIASSTLVIGERLTGAVSLANVAHHRVSAIELVIHSVESAEVPSSQGPFASERWVWLLREGKPADGEAIPFDLTMPDHLTPSFTSRFVRLTHELRVRVVMTLGDDVVLAIPVQIVPRGTRLARSSETSNAELPVVGRTAFTASWRAAAARLRERRGASASVRGSTLVIALTGGRSAHLRAEVDGRATRLVAELAWPAIGIDLRVENRKVLDRDRSDVVGLPTRFRFRAREPHQLRAVVHGPTVAALAPFQTVDAEDASGRFFVNATGAMRSDAFVDAFVDEALALDAQLATASARVPFPTALAHLGPQFEALAGRWGATLRRGDMSIDGFSLRGVEMSIRHTFDGPTPRARLVEAGPPPGAELPFDFATKLQAELGVKVDDARDTVVVVLDPTSDPDDLERVVGIVSAALRRLAPEILTSPYR